MDFQYALHQQEQAAEKQDQVASRDTLLAKIEPRLREPSEPDDGEEQRDARDHRERKPADARRVALLRRQPPDENRDEDDVVDAENDLEQRQRDECDPGLWVGEQLEHARA